MLTEEAWFAASCSGLEHVVTEQNQPRPPPTDAAPAAPAPGPPGDQLLLVDDDEQIRRSLERLLRRRGYACVIAEDATQARARLGEHAISLMLSDVNMPGESGIELADSVLTNHPDVAVLMVTGEDDPALAAKALELGAYGYIIKPFRPSELVINVANALRRRTLELESRHHTQILEQTVEARTADLRQVIAELERTQRGLRVAQQDTIKRLSHAAEEHGIETGAHIERASAYAGLLSERAGLDRRLCELVRLAAPLHDAGKISIPEQILRKPGPLSPDERELIETHSDAGYRILAGSEAELLQVAARIAQSHHERFDGSGYPRGLVGQEIPIEARIVSIADVFDALTGTRPYRAALTVDEAVEIMLESRGSHFDPELLDCFFASLSDVVALKNRILVEPDNLSERSAA